MEKSKAPSIPGFDASYLTKQIRVFEELLDGSPQDDGNLTAMELPAGAVLHLDQIGDSVDVIRVAGDATLTGSIHWRGPPLRVVVKGMVNLSGRPNISGLVSVIAQNPIRLLPGIHVRDALFYSRSQITLDEIDSSWGQFIAPSVQLTGQTRLAYPSFIISVSTRSNTKSNQSVTLGTGTSIDGIVMLLSDSPGEGEDRLIRIDDQAVITGAIYCQGRLTLDGVVHGCVQTTDFYFYDAPTTYMGWIRKGIIDRSMLPEGFLTLPGFESSPDLTVLSWL